MYAEKVERGKEGMGRFSVILELGCVLIDITNRVCFLHQRPRGMRVGAILTPYTYI